MQSLVQDERFASIIEAISYWLGYQFKIGRNQLIHEASLRYPIADAITAKGIDMERVVLEELHPVFKSKKIDLVIYDQGLGANPIANKSRSLLEVFEFKLAKYETGKSGSEEHQRVLNDVLRLAYHHKWEAKDCYFLMCGKYEDFKSYFVGQKSSLSSSNGKTTIAPKSNQNLNQSSRFFQEWIPDGLYKDWFEFRLGGEKQITFKKDGIWGLESFQDDYSIRESLGKVYDDNIKIKTICKAITPNGLENRTHAAGIWKIEAS